MNGYNRRLGYLVINMNRLGMKVTLIGENYYAHEEATIAKHVCIRNDKTVNYHVIQKVDGSLECSCPEYSFLHECKHLLAERRLIGKIAVFLRTFKRRVRDFGKPKPTPKPKVEKPRPNYFQINRFLSVRLVNDRTEIYVKNQRFMQCKYLLINLWNKQAWERQESIDSIDGAIPF